MRIPSTKLTKEMCNMAPVTLFDVTDDQNLNLFTQVSLPSQFPPPVAPTEDSQKSVVLSHSL